MISSRVSERWRLATFEGRGHSFAHWAVPPEEGRDATWQALLVMKSQPHDG